MRIIAILCLFAVGAAGEVIHTNLPATITTTVSTNVVNGDNATGCNLCFDNQGHWKGFVPAVMGMEPCKPYHPATERWTVTNVVRCVTLQTEWDGKLLTYSEETVVSSTTNRWKLISEWKENQPPTQTPTT